MIGLELVGDRASPLDILCVGAHADDIEIGCGATLLTLMGARPVRVTWVVFSAAGERSREARASAAGYLDAAEAAEVILHDFEDGLFPAQRSEIKAVFRGLSQALDPDVVFSHHEADLHQDHQLLGALTRETFRHHLILEYEVPKYDGGLQTPNVFVPVDDEARGRKVELLMQTFASQHDKHWFDPDLFDGLMRLRGTECGSPSGYAEGFHCRKATLQP